MLSGGTAPVNQRESPDVLLSMFSVECVVVKRSLSQLKIFAAHEQTKNEIDRQENLGQED